MDVTIKEVPDACVEEVKNMAAVAVQRYLEKTELQLDEAKVVAFNTKLKAFKDANGLTPPEPQDI